MPKPSYTCKPGRTSEHHGPSSRSAQAATDETPETSDPPWPQTPGNPPHRAVLPSPARPAAPPAILSGELNGPEVAAGLGAGTTRVSHTSSWGRSHSLPPSLPEPVRPQWSGSRGRGSPQKRPCRGDTGLRALPPRPATPTSATPTAPCARAEPLLAPHPGRHPCHPGERGGGTVGLCPGRARVVTRAAANEPARLK